MCTCTLLVSVVCLLCVRLTWIGCRDTDKWRCTLSSGSQRLNPSWLSLLVAPSYYLCAKREVEGWLLSVRIQSTVSALSPSPVTWLQSSLPLLIFYAWDTIAFPHPIIFTYKELVVDRCSIDTWVSTVVGASEADNHVKTWSQTEIWILLTFCLKKYIL